MGNNNFTRKRNFNDGVHAEAFEDEFENAYSALNTINQLVDKLKSNQDTIQKSVSDLKSQASSSSTTSQSINQLLLKKENAYIGSGNNLLIFGEEYSSNDFVSGARKYFCNVQTGDRIVFFAIRLSQVFDNVTKFWVVCDGTNFTNGHFLIDEGETILDTEYKNSGNPVLECLRPGSIYFYLEGAPTTGRFYFQVWIVRNMGGLTQ